MDYPDGGQFGMIHFPEDVDKLRVVAPILEDMTIATLYAEFSEDMYCAGWLAGPDVKGFGKWLARIGVEAAKVVETIVEPSVDEEYVKALLKDAD